MSQRTERFKQCPTCRTGKIRTDEIGKEFNAKINGKSVCADCKLDYIMAAWGGRPNLTETAKAWPAPPKGVEVDGDIL